MKRIIAVLLGVVFLVLWLSLIGQFNITINPKGITPALAQQGGAFPPVLVQAANAATDASGNWSVTWNQAFQSASPFISTHAVVASGTQPIPCVVATRSSTGASGWCRAASTVTVSILGAIVNIFSNIPPTATPVMVLGRDVTQ